MVAVSGADKVVPGSVRITFRPAVLDQLAQTRSVAAANEIYVKYEEIPLATRAAKIDQI